MSASAGKRRRVVSHNEAEVRELRNKIQRGKDEEYQEPLKSGEAAHLLEDVPMAATSGQELQCSECLSRKSLCNIGLLKVPKQVRTLQSWICFLRFTQICKWEWTCITCINNDWTEFAPSGVGSPWSREE